jgi:hypothetical protein
MSEEHKHSSAGNAYVPEPPFKIYHAGTQIADAEGHLCSAATPEIAQAILIALKETFDAEAV